jgi:CHAD domain-containing protein/CYTH domain-containing protein
MLPSTASPDQPAEEGARRLALAYLEAARVGRARLAGREDAEALHDYRVALRRLRSCLGSYRRELRSTVTRKSVRRLRRLAHLTNSTRDLEVHLAWVAAQGPIARDDERPGIAWLAGRLDRACARSRDEMLGEDERLFPRTCNPLGRQLARYRTTIHLDPARERRTLAEATARHLRVAGRRLDKRLGRIRDGTDQVEIHRARIATKHLRYLLEPFSATVAGADALVERLKTLQDQLGDAHDALVFLPELDQALDEAGRGRSADLGVGLRTLADALRARGAQAFDTAAREWLVPGRQAFFDQLQSVGQALERRSSHGREVERKYLLKRLPGAVAAAPSVEIEQGYLPGERLVERLRRIHGDNGVELVRTVKEGSGLVRLEVEESVTPEVFDALWPLTEGRRLRKRRYRVREGDLTWEIDQFLDRDLVLAEIELPSLDADVTIPAWLVPHVQREVTDEPGYGNVELSRATAS